jgi:hypothetical protein
MARSISFWFICIVIIFFCSTVALAQTTGGVKGQVTDATGASIPGASIKITGPGGYSKDLSTDAQGTFAATGLSPGNYTVAVSHFGFTTFQSKSLKVGAGQTVNLPVSLQLQAQRQEVTISSETTGTVSTDPSSNAGQLVLKQQDIESLPDDPDDLASDLQALAGPAAGPNGGQIYIDGFTGGTLPPKNAIREIRINQNPFSAEFDQLGFGRIEIFTKPGSDHLHGSVFFNDSDSVFNSRNPFLLTSSPVSGAGTTTALNLTPSFQSRLYGGNLSGAISRKASFFLDVLRREIDDNAIINAVTLNSNLIPSPFSQAFPTPNRFTDVSARIDYQLSTNNTLVTRYSYEDRKVSGAGAGNFTLPSQAFDSLTTENRVQMTDTYVINPRVVNETRFQFLNDLTAQNAGNNLPAINVLQSFNGGGAQVGRTYDKEQRYELQNYTSFSLGAHSFKAGVRIRSIVLNNLSPNDFGGTFVFSGGLAPELDANNQPVLGSNGQPVTVQITSIEQYRRTLLFQSMGLPFAQIQALGGGASQFSISAGNPFASLNQTDAGLFFQDDWKVASNFTLSMGLRYEIQNNIHDPNDWAPRIGIAWAPGKAGKSGQGKWVIRAGAGYFYTRVQDTLYLNTLRYNGVNQLSYTVVNPGFYLNDIPPVASLSSTSPLVRYQFDNNLKAPYIIQSAIGVERQLPGHTTLAVNFLSSRGVHLLLTRNINAPLDGTYTPTNPLSGVRPYGIAAGSIYQYESAGILNQNQLIVNVNSRLNSNISLFGYYTYGHASSNTDTSATFPSDSYNLSQDYGRTAYDIRNKVFFGGSLATKFGIRLSPYMVFNSGLPFNITIGRDLNGDLQFTDRPSFAPASACGQTNIVCTRYGDFNLAPTPGSPVIPRNYGDGPSYFSLNLRLSKTWGFGESSSGPSPSGRGSGGRFAGGGGSRGGGGGGSPFGGGGGGRDMFGGGGTNQRYQLTLSAYARNLLNNVNDADFTGNLTSPYFGRANALYGGFGGGGGGGGGFGGGGAAGTNNRRLELGLRFTF